jgi:hypothetical protein
VRDTTFAALLQDLLGVAATEADGQLVQQLAVSCARLSGSDDVSIVLRQAGQAASLQGGSSEAASSAADLEQTNGEGPATTAFRTGQPVRTVAPTGDDRWPVTGPALALLGIGQAVAVPLQLGGAVLGTLTLYQLAGQDGAGSRREPVARGIELADAVTRLLLGFRWEVDDGDGARSRTGVRDDGAVVHQATGMVAIQLDCELAEALVRLRAHAYAEGRPLADVATAVVHGVLRFTP